MVVSAGISMGFVNVLFQVNRRADRSNHFSSLLRLAFRSIFTPHDPSTGRFWEQADKEEVYIDKPCNKNGKNRLNRSHEGVQVHTAFKMADDQNDIEIAVASPQNAWHPSNSAAHRTSRLPASRIDAST